MRGSMNTLVLWASVLALGCGGSKATEKGSTGKVSAVEALGIAPDTVHRAFDRYFSETMPGS